MGCSSRATRGGALLAEVPASISLYSRLFPQARALSDATIGMPLCKYRIGKYVSNRPLWSPVRRVLLG